jgi:hypothetical protein
MILLVGAGYWINGSADPFDENVPSEQSTETNQPIGDDPNTNNRSTNSDNNQEPNIINEQAPYYLMKEENGTISIYYCGDTGEETFIRHADIDYSSLSQGDQTLFLKGITAKTEEELQELLQDFGS